MKNITSINWFPRERLDPDFPLGQWFAGLWLYFKSFLYLCNFYMLGLEPFPYTNAVWFEVFYFALTMVPSLILAWGLWNKKQRLYTPAIIFLAVDTPVLFFHVFRLAEAGFLDSGLTKALEFGSLFLNVIAAAWFRAEYKRQKQSRSR